MNIGTAIKLLRKERGLGQKELSEMCGISVNSLSLIETSITSPQKSTLDKICKALKVKECHLFLMTINKEEIRSEYRELFEMQLASLLHIISK